MVLFARVRRENDITATNLGKVCAWRLVRGDREMRFTGRLLGFYHLADDAVEPAVRNQTHLESIAIFKTKAQYFVYYRIHHIGNEHATGRQVHVRLTRDMEETAAFIDSMTYANKKSFARAVVEDARAQDR